MLVNNNFMENYTQGNDPRMNSEKPETTYQMYSPVTGNLMVLVSDDKGSPVYFLGDPKDYKGGAVHQEKLGEDFIGDLSALE